MKNRGLDVLGALLVAFAILAGAWAAIPGANAQTQTKKVWGLISNCASPTQFLQADVTLSNALSLTSPVTALSGADGSYQFTPSPGYYTIKVQKDGYYDNSTAVPFRFDGTANLRKDFCLSKTPAKDIQYSVLVVESDTAPRGNETLTFSAAAISGENAAPTFNSGTNQVTLQQGVVNAVPQVQAKYSNATAKNVALTYATDFTVADYFLRKIQILTSPLGNTIISELTASGGQSPYYLNFTYTYSSNTTYLAYKPVVPSSYIAFKNGSMWPSAGNWTLDVDTGLVGINANFLFGSDVLKFTYRSTSAVPGASVTAYDSANNQLVASGTTASNGKVTLTVWKNESGKPFELRVTALSYRPYINSTSIYASRSDRIALDDGIQVVGHAFDENGGVVDKGLVAYLYNVDPSVPLAKKVLTSTVSGSLYTFYAYTGVFRMIVDADGYQANVTTLDLSSGQPPSGPVDVTLSVSDEEVYSTTVVYQGGSDWNNITVYRNLTLNADSQLPGLEMFSVRDIRMQIDYALSADKDGIVNSSDLALFSTWLLQRGPRYVSTNGFFTTNSKAYLSDVLGNVTDYSVSVDLPAAGNVWINASTNYTVKDSGWIQAGKSRYYVNLTGVYDTNATVLQDQVFMIKLPPSYEATSRLKSGAASVSNYTWVVLDPEVSTTGSPVLNLVVEKSASGTARAKVIGPSGKFFVLNSTFTNYEAMISSDADIQFSAEESTDPNGNIVDANFTWRFNNSDEPAYMRWGMKPTFNYTIAGEYTVNLTLNEAGWSNTTYRNIVVRVDSASPQAKMITNKTSGDVTGQTVRINEDVSIKFDGSQSSDLMYGSTPGKVTEWHWDFDSDGVEDRDGQSVNWTYSTPGHYNATLWVVDAVGHKSANATVHFIVNDTTAPSVDFVILEGDRQTTSIFEKKTYNFNASKTTDNFDSLEKLNFTWDFGDGTAKVYGVNVTHSYDRYNSSIKIKLTVTDTGFLGQEKGNNFTLERTIAVQIDTSIHPDLLIEAGSFVADPGSPEEGNTVTLSVNVTNKKDRGAASSLSFELKVNGKVIGVSGKWYVDGTEVTGSLALASNQTAQLKITWIPDSAGNKTLEIKVWDGNEPSQWIDGANSLSQGIVVKEAWWRLPLIIFAFFFIIVGIPLIYFAVRRVRSAGGLKLRKEKEGEEGVKKEKKRL